MNNYFTLRRANRLRVKLLNSKSQEQIREVIRYLRRTSWDECGVELIYSDLIDMAVQANENGQELFNVIEDAKTFAEEVKPSLKTLRTGDYFWFVAPLYFFFGWGIESLLLYPVVPDWVFELSLGYLMQLVVCITAFCWLFRRMMEQAFAESQEMVVFVTELTVDPVSHAFLTENGCERYFQYNKDLLLDHRKAALQQELAAEQRRHGGV